MLFCFCLPYLCVKYQIDTGHGNGMGAFKVNDVLS